MSVVAITAERVTRHTAPEITRRIDRDIDARLCLLRELGPEAILCRLDDLDREWDIERCLETGASSLTLIGLALAATTDRRWILRPIGVAAFLLQHALQGWCPPLPLFRRAGVRTADEINRERCALRAELERMSAR
jgi:hypothetical protein